MFTMKIDYPIGERGVRRSATRSDIRDVLRNAYAPMNGYKPLNKCNARYFSIMVNDRQYTVLQSYSTNVALYSERTGSLYVLDSYSVTTTQHVWKFARLMGAARIVRLFRSSVPYIEQALSPRLNNVKCNAKQWRQLIETDFASFVEHL